MYSGLAGGSLYSHSEVEQTTFVYQKDHSTLPMEFLIIGHNTIIIGHPCFAIYDHNVPCAVCYTSKRVSKLIIPARITCPSSWTEEYEEYLKAERHTNFSKWCIILSCYSYMWYRSSLSSICYYKNNYLCGVY